jgi:hypothetical protein
MSAWTVSAAHIDALINSALEHGVLESGPKAQLDAVGQVLWAENYKSVNYRYDEDTPVPDYSFTGTEKPLDPVAVLTAAHSYAYQSCEHPGWESSLARRWVTKLIVALEADPRVPGPGARSDEGWDVESLKSIPAASTLLA